MADIAVVVFPGSNCDRDALHAFSNLLGRSAEFHWHDEPLKKDCKLAVLPGGFSYGDYLRVGAIARFSPAVESLPDHLARGGSALGICNGFQILVEAKLLPGTLVKNRSLRFQCEDAFVRVEENRSPLLAKLPRGQVLKMPIAHSGGRYLVTDAELQDLEAKGQVVLRYTDPHGQLDDAHNVNGSCGAVAGVTNEAGNVLGLMPHPERSCESILGSVGGLGFLRSIVESL